MTQIRMSIPPSPGKLPVFTVRRLPELGDAWLKVTCKRCRRSFAVQWRLWARSHDGDTRPCPYCFKVSYIRKHQGKHHNKESK